MSYNNFERMEGGIKLGINHAEWDNIFKTLVFNVTSPDGRDTFETSGELTKKIIDISSFTQSDTVMDMGAGWGNLSMEISPFVKKVIAVEPSQENIKMARKRISDNNITNVSFIQGRFENPNCAEKVDIVLSSLTFHQVSPDNREKAVEEIRKLLRRNGIFIICDTLMFFDPEKEPEKFNDVYRYILPKTMPKDIFKKNVEPYLNIDPNYIYTWKDMKRYTPKDNWFYSLRELENIFQDKGFKIEVKEEITPFFGIVKGRLIKEN